MSQSYDLGMGFSCLQIKNQHRQVRLTFRFPKVHTQYKYFNLSGSSSAYSENLTRTLPGRFIYENSSGGVAFPVTVNASVGGNYFLVGNHSASDNPSITSVKVYDGNTRNKLPVYRADAVVFVTVAAPAPTLPVRFTSVVQLSTRAQYRTWF